MNIRKTDPSPSEVSDSASSTVDPDGKSNADQKHINSQENCFKLTDFWTFLFKALIGTCIIYFFAKEFAINAFWIVLLSVFLLSLPIGLSGIYSSTIRQIQRLTIFKEQGWFYKLFFGRSLKVIFWTLWALGTSFFMLIQLHSYNQLEWLVFFLIIPVFWIVFTLFHRFFAHEFKPYVVTNMSLIWARRLSPVLMLFVYLVLMVNFADFPEYSSLAEAIAAEKKTVADMNESALVMEASQYLAVYNGIKIYTLGRLGYQQTVWLLVILGGGLIIFYNACAMLSCLLIPREEYRRIFIPLSTDIPPTLSLSHSAVITAVFTFLALFIYLPLFTYLDYSVKQSPRFTETRLNAESKVTQKLEQIDQVFFKQGTLEQLQAAKIESLRNVDFSLLELDSQIDLAFIRLESNVDNFLDWYYSLVGEYARIANMMTGEIEEYLIEKFNEYLQQGDAFKDVQAALNNVLKAHATAQREYREKAQLIMEQNRVDPVDSEFHIVKQTSTDEILSPPVHEDIISLQHRLGGAAISGVLTALLVKKIIGKMLGKNVLKLAVKALSKVAISKTAGTAGGAGTGALAGAAIGSVLPGLGTAAGAVIGGIIGGIAVGLTVDKVLIELEEAVNRDEFKGEILCSIQEARTEFKAELKNNVEPNTSPYSVDRENSTI